VLLWRLNSRAISLPAARAAATASPPSAPAAQPAEAAPLPPLTAATDLNRILSALEPSLRKQVLGAIDFRLSLLPELWPCRTDRDAVAALVGELVGAAIRELRAGDTLIVGTRNAAFDARSVGDYPGARIGEFARITVRDSGPGLTDAAFEDIFDPNRTQRAAVAAAARVMDLLGGFARVESAEDIGTAVHLYFPRAAETLASDKTQAATAPPARHKASGSRSIQRRSRSLR
jgi:signal transduction histidine kinase